MSRHTVNETVETMRGHRYIRLKSGRLLSFWQAHTAVEYATTALATAFSRVFKLADSRYELDSIERLLDKVDENLAALRHYLKKRRRWEDRKDQIAALRNTSGRTPEEAAEFLAKADKWEEELHAEQRKNR